MLPLPSVTCRRISARNTVEISGRDLQQSMLLSPASWYS
jgi:hypothetical protein